jgi:hypothetical protein
LLEQYKKAREAYEDKKKELEKMEELLNGLASGISRSGDQIGYAKLIQDEKKNIALLQAELAGRKANQARLHQELKVLLPNVASWESAVNKLKSDLELEEKSILKLKVDFIVDCVWNFSKLGIN